MKMDKRKATVNYSFTIKVRFLLVISFITNSLVFWQNCVYVLADISQDKRLTTRIVTTKYGSLRGLHLNLPHNLQPIEMFLGIPYASPPTGKLRFMPPVTPAHWPGIRIADKHGPVCPQRLPDIRNETEALQKMNHDRLVNLKRLIPLLQNQSEDCLYLNIYTPAKASKSSSSYPVIMFIHGESYEWNSGSAYDGSILSSFGNLIVVTINYRLGVLGFYPAMDGSSRGNFGLMDQVAALHWIQENIEEFGGNPSNVTIHGHGYGAALVNLLMLSPMAKGLFHRAIMQSGSALCPWALAFNAIKYGREFAQAVGCYQEGFKNSHIVDCLRHKTVPELLSVQLASPRFLTGFGPMVDGIVIASDPLALMNDPSSTFSSYSLLIGLTRLESYNLLSSTDFEEGISEQRRDKIIRTLVRNIYSYHLQEIYLTISNEYTDWTQSNPNNQLLLESLSELLSDALFVGPVVKTAMIHSKLTKSTKLYYFSHTSALMLTNHSRLVSVHGQDLPYSFGQYFNHFDSKIDLHHNGNHSRVDIILSEIIMKYWSNFAKSGDPNNREGSLNGLESRLESIHWPSYDPIQQQYLLLNTKPKIKDHYHAHRLSYWLNLIPKLHSTGTSASFEHHLLEDHDNIQTYEGLVRNVFASLNLDRIPDLPVNKSDFMIFGKIEPQLKSSHRNQTTVSNENQSESNTNTANRSANFGQIKGAFDRTDLLNGSFSMIVQDNPYSTALSVTIAVGCSLLILNILVFAGVFLHRDRTIREGQDNSNCQRESICGESRGSQYKYNSRVKFTKVKNEVGPTCIHHCPYNVDSAVTENYANCSGYHYQTSPEACSASISGPGDDHCNCPLVNLAYYVCDCRETEISGHHHHHHHHPDGPCKADEEEGDTDKVDKQIIGVSEEFETSQQLLTSS